MRSALFLILLGALLCGCGQKGPLFIPNDTPAGGSASPSNTTTKTQP